MIQFCDSVVRDTSLLHMALFQQYLRASKKKQKLPSLGLYVTHLENLNHLLGF